MTRLASRCLLLLLLALLALAGCRREVVAPGDPVAAVKGLAQAVRDNDLLRYSRLSLPPTLHQQMEARWKANLALAPAPTPAQEKDYARWMGRLTEPLAETRLYASFDRRMKKIETDMNSQWPLMQATGGIFLKGVIQANGKLSPEQKDHAQTLGSTLLDWLKPDMLRDRRRARQAVAILVETSRDLDLPTLASTRRLEMGPSLDKASRVLRGLKDMGRVYGLDVDQSLAGVEARVEALDGDIATMDVSYPLLGKTIHFPMRLLRRDGRWYSADAVAEAEAELAHPPRAARTQP